MLTAYAMEGVNEGLYVQRLLMKRLWLLSVVSVTSINHLKSRHHTCSLPAF